jgi:hypothetical protein
MVFMKPKTPVNYHLISWMAACRIFLPVPDAKYRLIPNYAISFTDCFLKPDKRDDFLDGILVILNLGSGM